MVAAVETMAYAAEGGLPWHGLGHPVSNDITVDEMLTVAGLDWTVSKRPLYFPKTVAEGERNALRVVPGEYALVRDSDESVLDTVGENYNPVQNRDIFEFFRRFCEAGDMKMETAGSLRDGRFTWALARFDASFKVGRGDETRGYVLLSQPHQFGYSLTAALTPVRVVCWNTLSYALGSSLDGSTGNSTARFRMVHSRVFDEQVRAEAELALGLASEQMKALGHAAEYLASKRAREDAVMHYFRALVGQEQPEDDTEAAAAERAEDDSRTVRLFRENLLDAPGQGVDGARDTWWGAYNATSYVVDHVLGRTQDTRLHSAWFGRGASLKRNALLKAMDYAEAA